MEALYCAQIPTGMGEKTIAVYAADVLSFDQPIDILTTSAYCRSYHPTPGTLFHAFSRVQISVEELAADPEVDLRDLCHVWLSKPLTNTDVHIARIGCVEMMHQMYTLAGFQASRVDEPAMLRSVKAYFQMLDIAAVGGVKMDTVAIPVLGSGCQNIAEDLILIPLLNECVEFLKRNSAVKRVYFVEKNEEKARRVAQLMADSYTIRQERQMAAVPTTLPGREKPLAFISYSSPDRNVADNLCAKLEAKGVQVWYAPRNVYGDYATAIAQAILQATHFIVILSKSSMASEHVLNEIDLAFKRLPNNIKFNPLRIDEQEFAPAFDYYLSRQHWMDAYIPPLEERLNEFVAHFVTSLSM